jgi:hypothetical protein
VGLRGRGDAREGPNVPSDATGKLAQSGRTAGEISRKICCMAPRMGPLGAADPPTGKPLRRDIDDLRLQTGCGVLGVTSISTTSCLCVEWRKSGQSPRGLRCRARVRRTHDAAPHALVRAFALEPHCEWPGCRDLDLEDHLRETSSPLRLGSPAASVTKSSTRRGRTVRLAFDGARDDFVTDARGHSNTTL